MKKMFTFLAMALCTLLATAQTNQYFWLNGNLMFGTPIAQTDSITFGVSGRVDTLQLLLPQALTIVVHDTIYINNCDKQDKDDNPEGALPCEFSVSPTKKVRFSKGNLQYNAALGTHQCADGTTQQGTWRFAEHQWDYVGDATNGTVYENGVKCDNSLISQTYNGWIDLFGWGTSGWNNTSVDPYATKFEPWDIEPQTIEPKFEHYDADYDGYGPSPLMTDRNLTGKNSNYDWGVYNAISNGENQPQRWRLLSFEEWEYLCYKRPNADKLCCWATIDSISGIIFLPDDWNNIEGITFILPTMNYELCEYCSSSLSSPNGFNANIYSLAEWKLLEYNGAIFLPNTGIRGGNNSYFILLGSEKLRQGFYWNSTRNDDYSNCGFKFDNHSAMVYMGDYGLSRGWGCGVRLVQDVE